MAVTGAHVLLYTPEAEALRAVLRDVLGWSSYDAGDGWLIFDLPPGELGVHPSEPGDTHHELALTCDDIARTVAELRARGIETPRGAARPRLGRRDDDAAARRRRGAAVRAAPRTAGLGPDERLDARD